MDRSDATYGYPVGMSQRGYVEATARNKKLKEYHAPADHYSTLSTMFYQLGLSTAPLHEVIRHIREGEYKRESSQDYRRQNWKISRTRILMLKAMIGLILRSS